MMYSDPTLHSADAAEDEWLTRGVPARRCVAWCVDALIIGALAMAAWVVLLGFGIATLGLGLPLLGLLPCIPFAYNVLWLLSPLAATPGQAMLGLRTVRDRDFGPPEAWQALFSTVGYYVTLSTAGLLLLVALVTRRRRTLHDLVSGLVVVRSQALAAPALTSARASWNMRGGSPYA